MSFLPYNIPRVKVDFLKFWTFFNFGSDWTTELESITGIFLRLNLKNFLDGDLMKSYWLALRWALSLPVPTKTLLVALQSWMTLPSNQYLNPNFEEDAVFSLVFLKWLNRENHHLRCSREDHHLKFSIEFLKVYAVSSIWDTETS
jgi:hypothetical protein